MFFSLKSFVAASPLVRACRGVIAGPGLLPVVIVLVLSAPRADAAEIEPRAYGNSPVGINFLVSAYAHSEGGLATAASSPISDAHLGMDTGILAYVRTMDVWGKPGKIDVILPYSNLSGNAMVAGEYRERNVHGFHDPRFRFSVNFLGAPVLSVQEFSGYRQDLIVGASVQVSAPLGQYDPDKLVNLGTNRWFVKPEIGLSNAWGKFTLELSTGMFFFSENDDFYGGKTMEQDPVSSTQVHALYEFGKGYWASLSGTYDYGGRTTVDGVKSDDLQSNSRVGVTVVLPINRNNSIKLNASTGISIRTGNDYDLVGIAWQYRWGNGL